MTDRELKRLSRRDLLEMLVDYSGQVESMEEKLSAAEQTIEEQQRVIKKNDSLLEELEDFRIQTEELESKLEQSEEKLRCREINMNEAGSIAEAALRINGIFEACQKAANQYLENVKGRVAQTDVLCRQREQECAAKCAVMEQQAKTNAEKYYQEAAARLKTMIEANAFLQKTFEMMYAGQSNGTN